MDSTDATASKKQCRSCMKRVPWTQLVTIGRRRAGNYRRAGSSTDTKVCEACVRAAVENTRERRYGSGVLLAVYLDDDFRWSQGADQLGIDYSDLPRSFVDVSRCPEQYSKPLTATNNNEQESK